MKRSTAISIFLLVLLMGFITRFFELGQVPVGPNWDEAAIGYNGWSVWTIHRDEWLEFLPLSFRSFGDYKAPLAIYMVGLFTVLLDLSVYAVRLPFAMSSMLSIIGFFLLVRQLFPKKSIKRTLSRLTFALMGMFFIASSPWHILFSRMAFESGLTLTQVIWGVLFLLWSSEKKVRYQKWLFLLSSAMLFVSTLYTYHSAKVMVPVFLLGIFFWLFKTRPRIGIKETSIFFGTAALCAIPFVYDSVFGEGLTRAGVIVFAQPLPITDKFSLLIQHTLVHFSPKFLLYGAADSIRHSIGTMGVLSLPTLILTIVGTVSVWTKKLRHHKSGWQLVIWAVAGWWILSGLLPAIIGVEAPHPNRALLALPGFLLMALLGLDWLISAFNHLKQYTQYCVIVISIVVIAEMVQLSLFLNQYFTVYRAESSQAFQDGYSQLYSTVWRYVDGTAERNPVDQVVITSEYGQPYMYALFSRKISAIDYHNGALVTFLFPDQITLGDLDRENALIVAGKKSDLIDRTKAVEIISAADGEPVFWVFDTETL